VPLLQDHYRLVMPDLRGHGWTGAPPDGYDKEQLATDLLGLLDALELDQVGLVGHDWGGWTGFLAALRAPERFSAFLALGIVHPFQRPTLGRALQSWRLAYQVGLSTPVLPEVLLRSSPHLVEQVIAAGTSRREVFADGQARTYGEVLQEPARARASVLLYRSMVLREGLPVVLGRYRDRPLTVPTRLVVGDGDPVAAPALLEGAPPGVEVEVLPGSATSCRRRRPGPSRSGRGRCSADRPGTVTAMTAAAGEGTGAATWQRVQRASSPLSSTAVRAAEELPWFAALPAEQRSDVGPRAPHGARRLRPVAAGARAAAPRSVRRSSPRRPRSSRASSTSSRPCSSSASPSRSSSGPSRALRRRATSRCCARPCCATRARSPSPRRTCTRLLPRRVAPGTRASRRGSSTRSCAATPAS
jgi:pimeloyl-ACP methyl ester carboxylesterase